MKSVELFAGAGGMALGVSAAGFSHAAVVERDRSACDTIRANQRSNAKLTEEWPILEEDVSKLDYGSLGSEIALLSGGPPCQPFSQGGSSRGHEDPRNMFPEAVRAVYELRPRAFIFENVRGLLRSCFAEYVDYLRLYLAYPDLKMAQNENWKSHSKRLEKLHTSGAPDTYRILARPIDAADYGIPQHRDRVVIVGIASSEHLCWAFPETTHSEEELFRAQWISGEYWDFHQITKKNRPEPTKDITARIAELKGQSGSSKKPWQTVRDAISGLPHPGARKARGFFNHEYIPGARSYAGHTGSVLDKPAKALKAGNHGVPGGENMLLDSRGELRYFTIRECARLQTFPDGYIFEGPWSSTTRQLGNAVPVNLAHLVARSLIDSLRAPRRTTPKT